MVLVTHDVFIGLDGFLTHIVLELLHLSLMVIPGDLLLKELMHKFATRWLTTTWVGVTGFSSSRVDSNHLTARMKEMSITVSAPVNWVGVTGFSSSWVDSNHLTARMKEMLITVSEPVNWETKIKRALIKYSHSPNSLYLLMISLH